MSGSYVSNKYKTTYEEKTGWWWLRSPGFNSINAAYVNFDGGGYVYGYIVATSGASVRPALWLNL
jgi:hypothetical protein